MPIYKYKNEEFFEKWMPEMAYVLGFLYADGYVFTNPRGSKYLCFSSTDKDIIEKIRSILAPEHKISSRKRNDKWKVEYILQVGSKKLVQDVEKLGVRQNKSLTVEFPKSIPNQYFGDFLRGYFDGDGGITAYEYWCDERKKMRKRTQARFVSGSRVFVEGLREALSNCTKGGSMILKNDGSYVLVYSKGDLLPLFNLMYKNNPGIYLKRKFDKFQEAVLLN